MSGGTQKQSGWRNIRGVSLKLTAQTAQTTVYAAQINSKCPTLYFRTHILICFFMAARTHALTTQKNTVRGFLPFGLFFKKTPCSAVFPALLLGCLTNSQRVWALDLTVTVVTVRGDSGRNVRLLWTRSSCATECFDLVTAKQQSEVHRGNGNSHCKTFHFVIDATFCPWLMSINIKSLSSQCFELRVWQ